MASKADSSKCSCTALRKATRRISQLYDTALAPSGLKITQRAILSQICRSEPTNVGLLADVLVMDSGALAHTLKPLEREGFISIEVNPEDRRHRHIRLTTQGRAKLAESDSLWAQAEKNFETAMGRAAADSLRTLLQRVISDDFVECFNNGVESSTV